MDLVEPKLDEIGALVGDAFESSTALRRARWLADGSFSEGSLLQDVRFRAQVDFAGSEINWKDLYVRYDGLGGLGPFRSTSVRGGQLREPFGLEAMTSVSHLPFIERSTATNAFTPGRSRGVQWSGTARNALIQLGLFRASSGRPFPGELGTETAATGRFLWQADVAKGFAQCGATLSVRDPGENGFNFSARPGTRLLPQVVSTGTLSANKLVTSGFEALLLGDRWSSAFEWFTAAGSGGSGNGALLSGGHVSFAGFITEGAPRWNRARGGMRAPNVADAWTTRERGNGAVEAAARLSWVDLDDAGVRGGRTLDAELGLNWYLQPGTRVMLHWACLRVDAPSGEATTGSLLLARLQLQL